MIGRGMRRLPCLLKQITPCLRLIQTHAASGIKEEASFPLTKYKLHRLASGPPTEATISRSDALTAYKQMKSIRCMEEAVVDLYKTNHARRESPLSAGQEGGAVGIWSILRSDDAISTSYRNHAWAYLKGLSMHQILAEITGRSTGSSKGKGGSLHLYKKNTNFFGGSAITGSQVPLGAGMALAMKYLGRNNISVAFYGEGTANQGQVAETYNMAKLWDLPLIFVCENNKVARQADVNTTTACTEFYTRGDFVPGIWVNGMDFLTVREASRWAARYCRDGYGPIVLELDTAHFYGHSVSSENCHKLQIDEEETAKDPIQNFANQIIGSQLCSQNELQEIDDMISSEVLYALEMARTDHEPNVAETGTEILKGLRPPRVRGCDPFTYFIS